MPSIQFLREVASQKLSNGEPLEKYLNVLHISVDSREWNELVGDELFLQMSLDHEATAQSVGRMLAYDLETVIRRWTKTLQRCLNQSQHRL